ncbi:PIN domain-containing protein [Cyanobium sp. Morenito 9A2]|uniref:PIN domain-containing protein n=1 Tax=Cyanobium sp. Morenito 9A2 TaxID=2823718 RepID=UPI0020CCBC9A|nr:PIN domain-containing protein [Cyanobium sp. Morenito 9A2]MCP9849773.1 PIN domain-containing protein [Cyanobium sp. Morenito 9A2]
MLLLDTNSLIDVLRGERPSLAWLESFLRLPLDHSIARESVLLRQSLELKVPDAIILATATVHGLTLATRNVRVFPLTLQNVVHPYAL